MASIGTNGDTDEYLVRRIVDMEALDEAIEQTIAVVDAPEHWTVDRLLERAYDEANMSVKGDPHIVSKLDSSVEVESLD